MDSSSTPFYMTFNEPFDEGWANKYSIKATRMSATLSKDMSHEEFSYGGIYRLCYLLWLLKVWKP